MRPSKKWQTAEFGSISHGTLREEDLIPEFCSTLRQLGHRDPELTEIERRMRKAGYYESEDASYDLNETLCDMLQEHAPDFCYFGSHPGDGSDFGFWLDEDQLKEAVIDGHVVKVNDFTPDFILAVNDHGNQTLYRIKAEEVWAVV
jgi:hypothetical protein